MENWSFISEKNFSIEMFKLFPEEHKESHTGSG